MTTIGTQPGPIDLTDFAVESWNLRTPAAKQEAPFALPWRVEFDLDAKTVQILAANGDYIGKMWGGASKEQQLARADAICAAINQVYGSAVK